MILTFNRFELLVFESRVIEANVTKNRKKWNEMQICVCVYVWCVRCFASHHTKL